MQLKDDGGHEIIPGSKRQAVTWALGFPLIMLPMTKTLKPPFHIQTRKPAPLPPATPFTSVPATVKETAHVKETEKAPTPTPEEIRTWSDNEAHTLDSQRFIEVTPVFITVVERQENEEMADSTTRLSTQHASHPPSHGSQSTPGQTKNSKRTNFSRKWK